MLDMGPWVVLAGEAHGQAGQACGELETGPAAMAPGAGTDISRGLKWGPGSWAGCGSPWDRDSRASSALRALF